MKSSTFAKISLGLMILLFVSLAIHVTPTQAQDTTPTPETTASTPAPTDEASSNAKPIQMNAKEFSTLAIIILFISLLLWSIVFNYTQQIQEKVLATFAKFSKSGSSVSPTTSGTGAFGLSTLSELKNLKNQGESIDLKPIDLKIEGPESISVGKSGEFKATTSPNADISIEWSVEPANSASINPKNSPIVKIVPTVIGAFTLKANAKTDDNRPANASIEIAAIAQQEDSKVNIPTFGQGYGSIAISILILTIVLILGLHQTLPSAAVATILGAFAGYIFKQSPGNTSTNSNSQTDN